MEIFLLFFWLCLVDNKTHLICGKIVNVHGNVKKAKSHKIQRRKTLCNVPRRKISIRKLRRGTMHSVSLALCLMGFFPITIDIYRLYHELSEYP